MPTNKEIVTEVNEAFARGDMEGFLDFCTDDIEWHMMGDIKAQGKEHIQNWMKNHEGPECVPIFTVDNMIAEGDMVACDGDITMKIEGKPDWKGRYCDVYKFANGKIKQLRSYVIEAKKDE